MANELCAKDILGHTRANILKAEDLYILPSVGSTNTYLNEQLQAFKLPHGTVIIADQQTAGRGRLNRQWYSPAGKNVYLSLLWEPKGTQQISPVISLVVGIAVAWTLQELGIEQSQISLKWPNDVFLANQKSAGILIERCNEKLIIGIGLNVLAQDFASKDIDATSIEQLTNKALCRNQVAAQLINSLHYYLSFYFANGFSSLLPVWHKFDYLAGKNISIENVDSIIAGSYLGVTTSGSLKVKTNDTVKEVYSGDVKVRVAN